MVPGAGPWGLSARPATRRRSVTPLLQPKDAFTHRSPPLLNRRGSVKLSLMDGEAIAFGAPRVARAPRPGCAALAARPVGAPSRSRAAAACVILPGAMTFSGRSGMEAQPSRELRRIGAPRFTGVTIRPIWFYNDETGRKLFPNDGSSGCRAPNLVRRPGLDRGPVPAYVSRERLARASAPPTRSGPEGSSRNGTRLGRVQPLTPAPSGAPRDQGGLWMTAVATLRAAPL